MSFNRIASDYSQKWLYTCSKWKDRKWSSNNTTTTSMAASMWLHDQIRWFSFTSAIASTKTSVQHVFQQPVGPGHSNQEGSSAASGSDMIIKKAQSDISDSCERESRTPSETRTVALCQIRSCQINAPDTSETFSKCKYKYFFSFSYLPMILNIFICFVLVCALKSEER